MIQALKRRLDAGEATLSAYAAVAAEFNVSVPTVKRAWKAVRNAVEGDWLPLLVKGYKGRRADEIAPEVLSFFVADYGRVEQPQLQATYERTVREAAKRGWGKVPSIMTLKRRWDAIPAAQRAYLRDGEKALARLFPYAERDRSGVKPLDGINVDGREWDVMVRWPDGREFRPTVTMVQDEGTNFLLSWIVADCESGDIYRRALCDTFARFGIPKRALFDNTRAAANKALTAGAKGRNRFKDNPLDIEGILPRIGCDPNFAQPENGQSKLVERLFAEIKERSERDPRLAGAYTGRSPSQKPANYGERAVPLELFKAVLAEAVEHYNTRTDRRGAVAYKTSHEALFKQGIAEIAVRRLSEAQRRLFFLVAERRTVTPDGSIKLGKPPHVNRYWAKALQNYAGQSVIARFDPDDLTAPLVVEDAEGRQICDSVPILEKRGFHSAADAREHRRAKRTFVKLEKQQAKELVKMRALELGGELPQPQSASAPSTPIIAPNFKAKPQPLPALPQGGFDAERHAKGLAALRRAGGGYG